MTVNLEVEESLKILKHHSPTHVTFTVTGKSPETVVWFDPPLELGNGKWRIALEDFRELGKNLTESFQIEANISPGLFTSNSSPSVVVHTVSREKKSKIDSDFRATPCFPFGSNIADARFFSMEMENNVLEKIKIRILPKPTEKKKRNCKGGKKRKIGEPEIPEPEASAEAPKKKARRQKNKETVQIIPQVPMEFNFVLKTDDQLQLDGIEDRLIALQHRKKSLENDMKEKSNRCSKCKQIFVTKTM